MFSHDEDFYLIVNGKDGRYTVEAQGSGQISTAPVPFLYQESLLSVELQEALEEIFSGYSPSREGMQLIGESLFKSLLPWPILMALGSTRQALKEGVGLRLRLNIRPPELARLPWELLFNPHNQSFLAMSRSQPVIRFLDSSSEPVASLLIDGPLKVLYVSSQPCDYEPLNIQLSQQALQETLGRRAEITVLHDATPASLRAHLRRDAFHILHYDGHGTFEQAHDASADERGVLLLQNEEGYAHALSATELSHYLDGTSVRLVLLAACESGMDSTGERFVGVAQRLMRGSNLPAVVAMQYSIPDESAIAFIRGFYGALADGYPVDAALADGRMAILEVAGEEEPDWATPILIMRTTEGKLWKRLIDGEEVKPILTSREPYLGLRTFQEEDAEFFFGREGLIKLLLQKVTEAPFLAVIGASGSGKSSVVLAGLLPALKGGDLPNSENWLYVVLKPGARPIDTLAAVLANVQGNDLGAALALRQSLRADDHTLLMAAEMLLANRADARLVLVVDQFEELWTRMPAEEEARQTFIEQEQRPFIKLLLTAVRSADSPLLIILTMRADFLHRAASTRQLAIAIGEHDVIVSPMERYELSRAIEQPALNAGGTFEPGLVNKLIEQTAEREGALPLLEYTLLELWKSKEPDGTMTWQAFHDLGGVEGALAARADQILNTHYQSAEEQSHLRHLLLRLVEPGEGTADTRRRAFLHELVPVGTTQEDVQLLLKPLVDERLLTTSRDPVSGQETLEVSHEALIRAWPTFGEWINQNRQDILIQRRLTEAAVEWQKLKRDPSALYRGTRLAQALDWAKPNMHKLNTLEYRFLGSSKEFAERESAAKEAQAQRLAKEKERRLQVETQRAEEAEARAKEQSKANRRLQKRNRIISLLFLIAFAVGFYADQQRRGAQQQRAEAEQQRTNAENLAQKFQSQALAVSAQSLSQREPMRALLLAVEAGHLAKNALAFEVINQQLSIMARPLFTLDHDGPLMNVQWNEDESRILTNSDDGTAKVWDGKTGEVLFILQHDDWVSNARWNEDESRILTGSRDATAKVWDGQTGEVLFTLQHNARVSNARWNQDESRILTSSVNGTAKVWDVQTREVLFTLQHDGGVLNARWNKNESRLLTSSYYETAKVWDGQTGEALFTLEGDAQWNQDGSRILTHSADGIAKVWDAQTGEALFALERNAQWNQDGSRILTHSADGIAKVWDGQTGEALFTLRYDKAVWNVQWNQDGSRILTSSRDGTAKVWDVQTGEALFTLRYDKAVWNVQWNQDGSRILTSSRDGTAKVWDVQTSVFLPSLSHDEVRNKDQNRIFILDGYRVEVWDGQTEERLFTLRHHAQVLNAQWNQDESQILTSSFDETANVWDGQTGAKLFTLPHHSVVWNAQWNENESRILTGSADGTAKVWDGETGEELLRLLHHDLRWVQWNKDGSRILTSSDKTAKVWDAQTEEVLFTAKHDRLAMNPQWNKDESRIFTITNDNITRVWDWQTAEELLTLPDDGPLENAQWNKDKSQILTISNNSTAKVSDGQTGALLFTLQHDGSIWDAQWNEDGSQILTNSEDRTAKVWDSKDGTLLLTLGDGTQVYNASWNAAGNRVLLATEGGKVFQYYTRTKELPEIGCQYATRNLTWQEWQQYLPNQAYRKTCEELPVHKSVPEEEWP